MEAWILDREIEWQLGCFIFILSLMACWEVIAARRQLTVSKRGRWLSNLGLTALNSVLLRLLLPVTAVGSAWVAAERGWGLLSVLPVPQWLVVPLSIVILDFAIWTQHVMFHRVPLLWRLHMVHHADPDLDVTSGARFHPLEMLLSLLIKVGVVLLVGIPAIGVFLFELILNATAMFNHSNVKVPNGVDGVLRWFLVTPDMHRVHHSVIVDECHTNFGFNLPWWDRLLGTYRAQPQGGHLGMTIGLTEFRTGVRQTVAWMLALPFGATVGGRPMRRLRIPTGSGRSASSWSVF